MFQYYMSRLLLSYYISRVKIICCNMPFNSIDVFVWPENGIIATYHWVIVKPIPIAQIHSTTLRTGVGN